MPVEQYDIFLSFNSEDRAMVQQIAVYLADTAHLKPWLDEWCLIPGEPWVRNLERGLDASSSCAVFVGKSGRGPWQEPEVESALRKQVRNADFRVIPVLLPDAPALPELPGFLAGNQWVDFRQGIEIDSARWRLECGIRGVAPGRGRPKQPSESALTRPEQTLNATSLIPASPPPAIPKTARQAKVFVSYRHQEPDSGLAHCLAAALQEAGHEVFIDTGLRWGSNWVRGIREALESSNYLLLLLSPDAAQSEMVVEEVATAVSLAREKGGLPILLPVRVHYPFSEPLPYQLSAYLRNLQQERWESEEDTSRLTHRLLETLEQNAAWREIQNFEAPPSLPARSETPAPAFDPRRLMVPSRELPEPGGAVGTDSRFYVLREADEVVLEAIRKDRAMVTILGARQTGKTSLVMGAYVAARTASEQNMRAAFIDFQALSEEDFVSGNTLWKAIAIRIAEQIGLETWDGSNWRMDSGVDRNFSRFIEGMVFPRGQETSMPPLLLCLDEVDRVFDTEVHRDFFSKMRAFYNLAAASVAWRRLRWLLSTSTEPSFFIKDLNQSPFNVGTRIPLLTFTSEEVRAFGARHGLLIDPSLLSRIMNYMGGQPYLTHLLLYHLARHPENHASLFDAASAGGGVFRDHLHRFLMQFQRDPELAEGMRRIVNGNTCEGISIGSRIEAAGLARRDASLHLVPLCGLYTDFFRQELS